MNGRKTERIKNIPCSLFGKDIFSDKKWNPVNIWCYYCICISFGFFFGGQSVLQHHHHLHSVDDENCRIKQCRLLCKNGRMRRIRDERVQLDTLITLYNQAAKWQRVSVVAGTGKKGEVNNQEGGEEEESNSKENWTSTLPINIITILAPFSSEFWCLHTSCGSNCSPK